MICTRCDGTGFLNIEQVPEGIDKSNHGAVLEWLHEIARQQSNLGGCSCHIAPPCSFCMLSHDVSVCDCCGNGTDWYGIPGEHFGGDDKPGKGGPYEYNGGNPECA